MKQEAIKLFKGFNLDSVTERVDKCKGSPLDVFYTVKTLKPDIPFRAIVSERGTWLHVLSGYLQVHLDTLKFNNPFIVSSSIEIVNQLKVHKLERCSAFSTDIEDLFYGIPHAQLIKSITSLVDCCALAQVK